MYFCYFVIISSWKREGLFIWTNLNPLHPRMLCAKFDWNWPSGSGEEDENVKSLRQRQQRRRTTDKFWSEKLTWAFGSGELKTKNKQTIMCWFDTMLISTLTSELMQNLGFPLFWLLVNVHKTRVNVSFGTLPLIDARTWFIKDHLLRPGILCSYQGLLHHGSMIVDNKNITGLRTSFPM